MAVKSTKKAASKKTSAPKAAAGSGIIVIEYPQEEEIITHPTYTIKISSSDNGVAEVSIDGGDWTECRRGEDCWWFDWGNYPGGKRKITARLKDGSGKTIKKSETRNCEARF